MRDILAWFKPLCHDNNQVSEIPFISHRCSPPGHLDPATLLPTLRSLHKCLILGGAGTGGSIVLHGEDCLWGPAQAQQPKERGGTA